MRFRRGESPWYSCMVVAIARLAVAFYAAPAVLAVNRLSRFEQPRQKRPP